MKDKELHSLLKEIASEQHVPPRDFTAAVLAKVKQEGSTRRSSMMSRIMSSLVSYVALFSLPIVFLLGATLVLVLYTAAESKGFEALVLLGGLSLCIVSLIALSRLPRKISRSQRMAVASGLLSLAAFMFVTRATVSLFFGADYADYEAGGGPYYDYGNYKVVESSRRRPNVDGTLYSQRPTGDMLEAKSSVISPVDNRGVDFSTQQDSVPIVSNTEQYQATRENDFVSPTREPLSTFSIDVDTASYANARRFLKNNTMPPKDAVRIEEFINYFNYSYPKPGSVQEPFSVHTVLAQAPWQPSHQLLQVALQGYEPPVEEVPASNLVFLIDVSGSMGTPNKLPLLQKTFKLFAQTLSEKDRVSIVVYAGAAGQVLPPTSGEQQDQILAAVERLQSGGSTAGGAGIELAYKLAQESFIAGGNNRVILATDGDFNVGISDNQALVEMIEKKRQTGIFLTVLGFGMGNYKDARLEQLANKGNGNYAYIDSAREAKKVLVEDVRGNFLTIAKDVKIQIEFNPSQVQAYRLIGYENRLLAKEDFNDDTKDAGELGAGHTVTAFYEIVPHGVELERSVDELKYQVVERRSVPESGNTKELATIKLRYKLPAEGTSRLTQLVVDTDPLPIEATSSDFRFSAAVAQFGMLLRDSEHKGRSTYAKALELAQGAISEDPQGYRREFLTLVETAQILDR